MTKNYLLQIALVVLFAAIGSFAQSQAPIFENEFYHVHSLFKNEDQPQGPWDLYTIANNEQAEFVWGRDYIMQAYAEMASNPNIPIAQRVEYWNTLIRMFSYVLSKRDNVTGTADHWDRVEDWWSNKRYQPTRRSGDLVHTGLLLYPMAIFAEYMLQPSNHGFATSFSFNKGLNDDPYYDTDTYHEIAEDLLEKIDQSVNAHLNSDQWVPYSSGGVNYGYFKFQDPGAGNMVSNSGDGYYTLYPNRELPYNQQYVFGKVLLTTYKALQYEGDVRAVTYKDKTVRMANHFRTKLLTHPDGGYVWWYEDINYTFFNGISNYPEDIRHVHITVDFPYLVHKENLSWGGAGTGPIFDANDMQKIMRAVDRAYSGDPLHYYTHLNGNTTYPTSNNQGSLDTLADHLTNMLQFSEWGEQLYHRDYDAMTRLTLDQTMHGSISAVGFLGLARMAINGRDLGFHYRPTHVSRDPGNGSLWRGVEGGDFDGDGYEREFVNVRAADDIFYVYQAGNNGQMNFLASRYEPGNWVDLATGNIASPTGDEIVAVRNYNGFQHFFVFNRTGSSLSVHATYTGFGNGSNWASICAGDFTNNGIDEIAAVRNNEGLITMLKDNNGSNVLAGVSGGSLVTNVVNWVELQAGDINQDGRDEIIGITENGKVSIFYYDGVQLREAITQLNGPWQGGFVREMILGDFDQDQKEDELVIMQKGGLVIQLDLSFEGYSGSTEAWKAEYHREELFDPSFFRRSVSLGTIRNGGDDGETDSNCLYDRMVMLRNSHTDGHMFIFDLGYEQQAPISCTGDPHEEENEFISERKELLPAAGSVPTAGRLYPNPGADWVTLNLSSAPGQVVVQVFDLAGRQVTQFYKVQEQPQQAHALDLSHLEAGVYLIRVEGNGRSFTERWVKQ
ncbi:MAG: T9SS type A sorting domain-containing protein [Salibacteraceae bacterium]